MSKRQVNVPIDSDRCVYNINAHLGHSRYQCSRKKVIGDLCKQHSKIVAKFNCEYCGGNDEIPQSHCEDCTRPEK